MGLFDRDPFANYNRSFHQENKTSYMSNTSLLGVVLIGILFAGFMALVLALPTMWLWNFVVPHISSGAVPTIGFWHALALNILCGILFKSTSSSSSSKSD